MKIAGYNEDKTIPVYTGVFKLLDTHGVPLPIICDFLRCIPAAFSVPDFIADARKAGWKEHKIFAVLKEAKEDR